MAKTTVNPGQAAFIQAQKDLASQGIHSEHIDRLLTKSGGIEEVFKDAPALRGYFSNATRVLSQMTDWDYDFLNSKAVTGSVSSPQDFKEYFQNSYDTATPVSFRDFIPAQYLENTRLFVEQNILLPAEAETLHTLLHGPSSSDSAPVDWSERAAPQEDPPGFGGGAAGNKAYGTGGESYKPYGGNIPGPPPGSGYRNAATPSYKNYGNTPPQPDMNQERDYIESLRGDPNYGLLSMLFGQDYGYRSFGASIVQQLESIRAQKSQLTQALANLDPTDPKQARQLQLLSAQSNELGNSERELMDKLGTAQRARDEMISLIKSMMDLNFKTIQTIISNTKG